MAGRAYKKIDFSRPHRGRRRKWKDMEITRVKLNPEQAVLTCCTQPERGEVATGLGSQCLYALCGTSLNETTIAS